MAITVTTTAAVEGSETKTIVAEGSETKATIEAGDLEVPPSVATTGETLEVPLSVATTGETLEVQEAVVEEASEVETTTEAASVVALTNREDLAATKIISADLATT